MFNQEFLEICKFVCSDRILCMFSRPRLSIRVVKSQNEFVTKPLSCTKGSVHDAEISKTGFFFENIDFLSKILFFIENIDFLSNFFILGR